MTISPIKAQSAKPNLHSRILLIGLFLVFVAPIFTAWYLYQHGSLRGTHTTNNGLLITPPIAFNSLGFVTSTNQPVTTAHQWLMVYYSNGSCDDICVQNLYKMRQVRIALNKEQGRVARILVDSAPDQRLITLLNTNYTGTQLVGINSAKATVLLPLPGLYIVDPLGNVMMQYAPDAKPKGILKDLNHLLRISQIG